MRLKFSAVEVKVVHVSISANEVLAGETRNVCVRVLMRRVLSMLAC